MGASKTLKAIVHFPWGQEQGMPRVIVGGRPTMPNLPYGVGKGSFSFLQIGQSLRLYKDRIISFSMLRISRLRSLPLLSVSWSCEDILHIYTLKGCTTLDVCVMPSMAEHTGFNYCMCEYWQRGHPSYPWSEVSRCKSLLLVGIDLALGITMFRIFTEIFLFSLVGLI
jgi:hypothetical protein